MIEISAYLNRITSQHKTKPRFMAFLKARLQPFIDLAECLESFDKAFDIDTAVGRQLDIIGRYIGVERLLNFQPQDEPALLSDSYYRMLLKARISLNKWDGTTAGIQKIWGGVFPYYTLEIVDNQNMTMNVRIVGLQSPLENEMVHHGYIVPKPMGVLIDFTVILPLEIGSSFQHHANTISVGHVINFAEPPPTEADFTSEQNHANVITMNQVIIFDSAEKSLLNFKANRYHGNIITLKMGGLYFGS